MSFNKFILYCELVAIILLALNTSLMAQVMDYPDPKTNMDSPLMLSGDWFDHPHNIDFSCLPKVPLEHTVVSNVAHEGITTHVVDKQRGGSNQHNYMIHYDGRFWMMWSDGPQVEDKVGQRVSYSTSLDGIVWEDAQYIVPLPPNSGPDSPFYAQRSSNGFRWIARGFWVREDQLIALASIDEADEFFGPSLELRAFVWNKQEQNWEDRGVLVKDAINNFPPKKTADGQWMMSRRSHNYKTDGVDFLVGGIESMTDWAVYPIIGSNSILKAEEPYWWLLPDGKNIMSLYRDNSRSGYLYRAFSTDSGRTWSTPIQTNFPDTASKFHGVRLADGRYVLVSNPRPERPRDPLAISISEDGMVFNKMGYLIGGRWVDYPHVMEHEGFLYVAFSGAKQTIEVLKINISDLDNIDMSQMCSN